MCIGLGYLGSQPPEGIYVIAGRILTFCYFAYFLIVLPLLARIETVQRGARFRERARGWFIRSNLAVPPGRDARRAR